MYLEFIILLLLIFKTKIFEISFLYLLGIIVSIGLKILLRINQTKDFQGTSCLAICIGKA